MSADNGIYILITPTGMGKDYQSIFPKEYRVAHIGAVDNLCWELRGDTLYETNNYVMSTVREHFKDQTVHYNLNVAYMEADALLSQLDICEYGISKIEINEVF